MQENLQTPQERLRAIIQNLGLNHTQFVEKINILTGENRTRQWIQSYLSDVVNRDYTFLEALEKLGYSLRWYLYGEGEMRLDDMLVPMVELENLPKLSEKERNELKERTEKIISEKQKELAIMQQFEEFYADFKKNIASIKNN